MAVRPGHRRSPMPSPVDSDQLVRLEVEIIHLSSQHRWIVFVHLVGGLTLPSGGTTATLGRGSATHVA